ncbi:hypothetical protein PspLS_01329 [Pyricularia sp. CBS 133598]|nr:hypothetical protein PspLS_01329 [Pyricularia sp. CBS 133598]
MEWVQRQLGVAQFAPANPGICAEIFDKISSNCSSSYDLRPKSILASCAQNQTNQACSGGEQSNLTLPDLICEGGPRNGSPDPTAMYNFESTQSM